MHFTGFEFAWRTAHWRGQLWIELLCPKTRRPMTCRFHSQPNGRKLNGRKPNGRSMDWERHPRPRLSPLSVRNTG